MPITITTKLSISTVPALLDFANLSPGDANWSATAKRLLKSNALLLIHYYSPLWAPSSYFTVATAADT